MMAPPENTTATIGTLGPYIIPTEAAATRTPIEPRRKARGITGVHTAERIYYMCIKKKKEL